MQSHSLTQLVEEHLAAARGSSAQRSAVTLYGGQAHDMRQTLITLAAGAALHEHESPGEATLQVLRGEVRLIAGEDAWTGGVGDLVAIPPQRHGLEAITDAAVILTVATRA